MYKIGTYKSGHQIASEVFESSNLTEIESEFKRMWEATEFDSEGADGEADDSSIAWYHKHFCEDTNHVAVFEVEESESLHTNYTYQGCESKMM